MSVPTWLHPLYEAERMRATDRWAIEDQTVPSLDLMERAGAGATRVVAAHVPAGRVAVVCGTGNNGGDGLVIARRLREQGRDVVVALTGPVSKLSGDAAANLERLPGDPPVEWDPAALDGADVIVDAMLGTGFAGSPRDPIRSAIEAINATPAPAIAVDVPSGVDASTGEIADVAVAAEATATFHAAKPGLWIEPGKSHSGEVAVIGIGIPPGAPVEPDAGLINRAVLDGIPRRGRDSTKFTSGNVLVAGGSRGLTGAPSMVAESAARSGAGYVTVCVGESIDAILEQRLLEPMTRAMPDDGNGGLVPAAVGPVLELAERAQALVLGPGLGRTEDSFAFARELAQRAEIPLVIDADGLNAHAGRLADLARRKAPTVLTPHAGELARLMETDSKTIDARRLHHVRAAAAEANAVVLLKGDDTIVATPHGLAGISRGGSPGLATAGTGDVLSGVIGALLGKRLDAFHAACAGVFAHAAAGRFAADPFGPDTVIASDVIAALPRALSLPIG